MRARRRRAEPGGWDDYRGAFDPEFQLEDLSQRALAVTCQEVAVQSHLLIRSYPAGRFPGRSGADEAAISRSASVHRTGAGITAQRLRVALAVGGDGAAGVRGS